LSGARLVAGGFITAAFAASGPATAAADLDHVFAMLADHLPTFASGLARFIARELVGGPLLVGRFATLSRDFTLPIRVHEGKSATSIPCHDIS
jgi:hypothetical protein